VHGDFYPGNIYFKGDRFTLLDRGRGVWGEAADDVASYTINHISNAVCSERRWAGPFKKMFLAFFKTYLDRTKDYDVLKFLAPFFAFRSVVVVHPVFYPNLPLQARKQILHFAQSVLETDTFDPRAIDTYLEA
jgi:hypothetical protein